MRQAVGKIADRLLVKIEIQNMKCPHCVVEFHDKPEIKYLGKDRSAQWGIASRTCPSCNRFVLQLISGGWRHNSMEWYPVEGDTTAVFIHPKSTARAPVPTQVDAEFAEDYNEACLVLSDSPKASAALSRCGLQHLLREKAGVKHSSLANEIQEVVDSAKLPSLLSGSLDAIRNIGNFAAHPTKSKNSGEVIAVEPGEAEWNLAVLESLFDFYFVQPDILQKKKDALNKKLADAGKPLMK